MNWHTIKQPREQMRILIDILIDLDEPFVRKTIDNTWSLVTVKGESAEVIWALFVERFNQIIGG